MLESLQLLRERKARSGQSEGLREGLAAFAAQSAPRFGRR